MKKLEMNRLENIEGGSVCKAGGLGVGLGLALGVAAVASGGVLLGVAAGLSLYFGTGATLLCGME